MIGLREPSVLITDTSDVPRTLFMTAGRHQGSRGSFSAFAIHVATWGQISRAAARELINRAWEKFSLYPLALPHSSHLFAVPGIKLCRRWQAEGGAMNQSPEPATASTGNEASCS